ncbi:transposase [Arthrobacter sp. SLBN-112]|uniref:transposase n=1 Tax=Arthrobacter sp. SLBN-112 TaxID=2768452 RepID=UPI001153536F
MITDGGAAIAAAMSECWSETAVQRCLVHVQRNVRTYLTGRPRTDAGKALLRLGRALTRITTTSKAAAWLGRLNDWHQSYGHLVKAPTYRNASAVVRAGCGPIRPGGTRTTGSVRPTGFWNDSARPGHCSPTYAVSSRACRSHRPPTALKAAPTPNSGYSCGHTAE